MLPSSRPEATWSGVLLLSVFTPWAIAEELPTGRYNVRARETVRTVAASDDDVDKAKVDAAAERRWAELKARHAQAGTAGSSGRAANAVPAPWKLIPDVPAPPAAAAPTKLVDDHAAAGAQSWFDEQEEERPKATSQKTSEIPQETAPEPNPIRGSADEQPWIYGLAPREGEESRDSAPKTAMRNAERAQEGAQEQPAPQAAPAEETEQVPKMKPPRRPRKIDEISPRYDLSIDQDIREFAAQQAQQYNVHLQREGFPQRSFTGVVYNWEASNLHYLPLYFQDPQLERYGHTYPCYLQPAASIARFGVQLIGMPYQMAIKPPWCPEYPLGWYRPGDVAPKLCYQIPWNTKAAAVEAGVITGAFFIIP